MVWRAGIEDDSIANHSRLIWSFNNTHDDHVCGVVVRCETGPRILRMNHGWERPCHVAKTAVLTICGSCLFPGLVMSANRINQH